MHNFGHKILIAQRS